MRKVLLSMISLSMAFGAKAQQDTTTVELSEVVIKENRMEIPFNKTSRNVSIIARKAIETTPARSLQEVLSFTPGVDVRQRGISGVQASVGIRGGSFEQTLMLLNGIKLTDPQTNNHMMNIPLPLQGIDRVEVLKGPGSRIYGQNAFAGAINVVTTLPETKSLNFQAYGGGFGSRGASLVTALPLAGGKYKQTLSFSHDASDGHWHNSDFKVSNLFYEGGLDLNQNNELKVMAAISDRTFGANGFYTDAFPDQWESLQTGLAALSHTYQKDAVWVQTRAYWRRNYDEFRLRRFEPDFFTNNHVSDVFALEANGRYEHSLGTTGFGVEGRKEMIDSNNLGQRERDFLGVFAEHRIEFLEKFDFRAGLYSNYFDEYGWKHFPGAELGFQLSNSSRFYTNYGISFRIPSFTELYYEDPSNLSNPDLQPEQARSFEIGYIFTKEGFRFETVYFNRFSDNLIDWNRAPSDEAVNPNRWTPRNISEVKFNGFESSIAYAPNWGGTNAMLKEVSLSYNFIDATLSQAEGVESRYALNALRNQFIAGLQAQFTERVELTLKGRYIERMALDPYFVMDARMDFNRMRTFGFFAEVSNITDTEYIEAGFVQMPGRWGRAGITVNLY
ncbi:TonB-dependent receptor [Litoribacter ruber]|uniref:TonB-dependent receptor plug domain-containing protein n=1 Tax=Litoribacter ruber TaxID=702568 RepID=UPI001BDAD752|nr:TonB-dependent receptor [Litoribacter ruber]MBT0811070.1 TonB-dependent receptor [Litoribacter ruber]